MAKALRAAIYLRVSRDSQTTENQRIVLTKLAERRGFEIVQQYEDQGVSGGKGRDRRPAFDQMLRDAMRSSGLVDGSSRTLRAACGASDGRTRRRRSGADQ
jgi:DNA invertase Pin-like site-specific DNA recombinase